MREVVWVIIVVLALYALYQLYLVSRMGMPRLQREEPESASSTDVEGAKPAPAQPEMFQIQLELQQLRRDVAQLRADQDERRREAGELEERVSALKTQLDQALLAPGVAPEYSEALVFARRGLDVDAIAERCGISVSEAELVRSLSAGREAPPSGGKP